MWQINLACLGLEQHWIQCNFLLYVLDYPKTITTREIVKGDCLNLELKAIEALSPISFTIDSSSWLCDRDKIENVLGILMIFMKGWKGLQSVLSFICLQVIWLNSNQGLDPTCTSWVSVRTNHIHMFCYALKTTWFWKGMWRFHLEM